MRLFFIILFLIILMPIWGQNSKIQGQLVDENNSPVYFVKVQLAQKLGAISDENGKFVIENVPYGNYQVKIIAYDYDTKTFSLDVNSPEITIPPIQLKSIQTFEEVEIVGKSKNQEIKEQAYSVNAIDLKPIRNLDLNVNQVLNSTTGIRIRESGGLGSDFSFSLSGFTGKQVRFFVDGLPTEYLGGAYSLNAIPVNILDRIEVYKGVVPVQLGSDVLGGAVNIVTKTGAKRFIDVSYGFGSFNTHKASVIGKYTFKNNFVIAGSTFYNYSKNNYKIDAYLYDHETGAIDENPTEVERFNDGYTSSTGLIEFGFENVNFADRLLIGIIGSTTYKEIQQGSNMTKVAGHVFKTDRSIIPTLKYKKDDFLIKNLNINISSVYSDRKAATVDTSSRVYSWDQSFTIKNPNSLSGELNWDKTNFTFNDKASLTTATISYNIGKLHTFTFNNTYSWFQRQGTDSISYSPVPFANPNSLSKNFAGISYKLALFNQKWQTTIFAKSLSLKTVLYKNETINSDDFTRFEENQSYTGFGGASTYLFNRSFQLKISYENTYRLPEGYEIFGDGLLLKPNYDLTAEKSQNFNANILFKKKIKKHAIQSEVGYLFRLPQNMIRLVAVGVTSVYENLTSAQVSGIEGAIKYSYNQAITVELNGTYQNMINTNQFSNGYNDPLYLDRIPNIPYLYGNGAISYTTKEFGKIKQKISVRWSTNFVEEFYLKWPSQGDAQYKNIIPRQIAHNIAFTWTETTGRYNISVACNNITDQKLYDNFKIQKPGRNFSIKLRYFIMNNNIK